MFVNRAQNYEKCAIYPNFLTKKCRKRFLFCGMSSISLPAVSMIFYLFFADNKSETDISYAYR